MNIKELKENELPGGSELLFASVDFSFSGYKSDPKSYWKVDKKKIQKPETISPYILNDTIKEVIKLAQLLERPILVKGEPGSGKTQLAKAIAYHWYKDDPLGYRTKFFEWHVKSTSKAVEGLYAFDHLARLRDTQSEDSADKKRAKDKKNYRAFGPMAKAFLVSREGSPAVLLIDEIDKADIDFPNDLLLELVV